MNKKCTGKLFKASIIVLFVILFSFLIIYSISNNFCRNITPEIIILPEKQELPQSKCEMIPHEEKFDCFPRGIVNRDSCILRGCCWSPVSENGKMPSCYYPKNFHTYEIVSRTKSNQGEILELHIIKSSIYPNDVEKLHMQIVFETKSRLHIKITDYKKKRFEPPYPKVPEINNFSGESEYTVLLDKDHFGFAVMRKETGTIIFDTRNIGGFIFSDQFLQLSALIPSKFIYGLGEQQNNFLLNTDWEEITLFNNGFPPEKNSNLYGSHPFYLAIEEGGISHGIFLLNSNAMDIVLQPAPAITYRTIGGVFDFYFFLGPSPNDVVKQYTEVIGHTFFPPYWSLGFHLCRYNYTSLNDTIDVWTRNRNIKIPYDVQWFDIDYMEGYNDFTIGSKFKEIGKFVEQLHAVGMKSILIIDAGVASREPRGTYPPYDVGIETDIFIKNSTGLPLEGKVWNRLIGTAFPDFTHPRINSYWLQMISDFYEKVHFDGLWLDMNEIFNFGNGSIQGCGNPEHNNLDDPPYVPKVRGGRLNYYTLCMSGKHYVSSHYDVHNLCGFIMSITTNFCLEKLRDKRPFVLSRSTFAGSGHYTAHWTGDVHTTWDSLRQSVSDIMSFGMFGIPMVGADICGFSYNTTEALCQRWSQLGAFYPFSRNHNADDTVAQDPAVFGTKFIESTRKALNMRYRLLPYLYTLFWYAHRYGISVIRPLFFEFPDDVNTYTINTQFLWGPGLMIVPVLTENATSVSAYFPNAIWYDVYTLEWHRANGDYIIISAPEDKIPLYFRGGLIIAYQEPGINTAESRKNPFGLYVALDEENFAYGALYWDDGESNLWYREDQYNLLQFKHSGNVLTGLTANWGYNVTMILDTIYILGLSTSINHVYVNNELHYDYDYVQENLFLLIRTANIDFSSSFTVTWV